MAKPWADKPFELLPIPGQPGAPTCANPEMFSVCVEMANLHNVLLRGLNSIYLQAPHVTLATDIADFLVYTSAWGSAVHHHHYIEETHFFPKMTALSVAAGLPADVMSTNIDQHHAFESKMEDMLAWVEEVKKGEKEWDSSILVGMIDNFAPPLTQHLRDEIDTLVKLDKCDAEEVKKMMAEVAHTAAKDADPHLVIPQMLGCSDKGYPGSDNFPPLPFFVQFLGAYWFSRKHKGCWRFNPCDQWGRPRPLKFV